MKVMHAILVVLSCGLVGCGTPNVARLYSGTHSPGEICSIRQSYSIKAIDGVVPTYAKVYDLLQGKHRVTVDKWGAVDVILQGGHMYAIRDEAYFRDSKGNPYSCRKAAAGLLSANNNVFPAIYTASSNSEWMCFSNTPSTVVWLFNQRPYASPTVTGKATNEASAVVTRGHLYMLGNAQLRPAIPNPVLKCSTPLKIEVLSAMLAIDSKIAFSNVTEECASLHRDFMKEGIREIIYVYDETTKRCVTNSNDAVYRHIVE